ncbi:MAG: hypothetical protein HOP15_04560 [Planctomycetes bacterium]|nr:hypothetical protein [Planctomycetota bacterium]
MRIAQARWKKELGWEGQGLPRGFEAAQLAFVFGGSQTMGNRELLHEVRQAFPGAHVVGCSTAGEIHGIQVTDDSLSVTAVVLERSRVQAHVVDLPDSESSAAVGSELARAIDPAGLVHVFVLSEGLNVNGSELVAGMTQHLPRTVAITGGLSGDGDRFKETLVLAQDESRRNRVAALAFYGEQLEVGYASLGGWDAFGPERVITRSRGNVLYELDGRSALELYKQYLGEHANGLPATGLLFPLAVRASTDREPVVRTILAVDEREQSMTFAGDLPQGSYARLMKANIDRLVEGASGAARTAQIELRSSAPELAILISCVGRKMVLKQRVEEEVEAVREVLGAGTALAGFYSYGEISPFTPHARCELHNQTMTITTFSEAA